MISQRFIGLFFLLLLALWLWSGQGWAQSPPGQRINYKLVPNLEAMQGQLADARADLIQSIDINSFICLPHGGKAVDAVIATRADAKEKIDI